MKLYTLLMQKEYDSLFSSVFVVKRIINDYFFFLRALFESLFLIAALNMKLHGTNEKLTYGIAKIRAMFVLLTTSLTISEKLAYWIV